MKLDKAQEVLEDLLGDGPYWPEEMRRTAVKLGIEALKAMRKVRGHVFLPSYHLLPGETVETDSP